ncbi:NAD(P)-dependent oxidoreductase [Enterococcus casseliflavus]|uniref:NAD-dependent epimerase/dehydratase family protein n=1 Tax=Enterococcus casseliflavus TaxID=37734 RepID=UPI0032E51CDF
MKILITGAAGYLGRGITTRVLDLGHEVIATDICTKEVDERAMKIDCNLFDVDNPFDFFGKPDVLLHLAWEDGFIHNSEKHISQLELHYKFIKKIVESDISRISIMGSMHEIGFYEGSIDENTPCRPQSLYGISKNTLRNLSELIAKEHSKVFQWLRGFYIVGNSNKGNSIFSKIVQSEMKGETVFPFTTGQNQFDFLDYNEFCYQVAVVVNQSKISGIINICSGFPERLSDRVERFLAENNYKIRLEYGKFPDRPYDSKAVWGNNKKIENIMYNFKDNSES